MSILVFVEGADGELKKSSKEAIVYASETGKKIGDAEIIAVVVGKYDPSSLEILGNYGAKKVIQTATSVNYDQQIGVNADILVDLMHAQNANLLIMTKSSFSDNVGGRVAGKMGASIVSNVVSLPDISDGFMVKKSIFTGKAFASVSVSSDKKVLIIKKNILDLNLNENLAVIEQVEIAVAGANNEIITGKKKIEGEVVLDEADIVVSGGRGLKGPENWGMIEDLARALGAATGCSKPVSDMGWRPHHEHVGQTGVKVSPNLYIAVGISGAIQHLAGVNGSKVLVAINTDPEAPFFKAADYGIVGDAFEIVPRLTAKVKSL